MPNHMSAERATKRANKSHRRRWIAPVVIVGVLLAVYLGGVAVFSFVFMPHTTLDGADVSLKTASVVGSQKSDAVAALQTHVTGNGVDLTVFGSDIDLTCDGASYARSALTQVSAWAWPVEVTRTHNLSAEAGVSFDHDKLAALLAPAMDESRQAASEDSGDVISYDSSSASFALDDRVIAQYLDVDAVAGVLSTAFAQHAASVVLGDECLSTGGSIEDAVAQANAYVQAATTLTLADQDVYNVTADQIAGWVTIADDLSVSLDTDAIATWCHGELSELLDTVGAERTYTRPDGVVETVNDGSAAFGASVYGWLIDGETAADELAAAIQAGQPTTLALPTLQEAAQVNPGGQDWGTRYIDVDIPAQHIYFYDNGTLIWDADTVTGQPSLNRGTPTGVWTVTNRLSGNINLTGPVNAETNEPEWDSHVQFWMGVVRNIVGFHNAPWRSTFGGQIYTWNGSHGCINLSYADGQSLYDLIQVGDVVVIHN